MGLGLITREYSVSSWEGQFFLSSTLLGMQCPIPTADETLDAHLVCLQTLKELISPLHKSREKRVE